MAVILSLRSSGGYNTFPAKGKRSVSILTLEKFNKVSICKRKCNYPLQFVKGSDRFSVFSVDKLIQGLSSTVIWFQLNFKSRGLIPSQQPSAMQQLTPPQVGWGEEVSFTGHRGDLPGH